MWFDRVVVSLALNRTLVEHENMQGAMLFLRALMIRSLRASAATPMEKFNAPIRLGRGEKAVNPLRAGIWSSQCLEDRVSAK
jgi:hypothetical protein